MYIYMTRYVINTPATCNTGRLVGDSDGPRTTGKQKRRDGEEKRTKKDKIEDPLFGGDLDLDQSRNVPRSTEERKNGGNGDCSPSGNIRIYVKK